MLAKLLSKFLLIQVYQYHVSHFSHSCSVLELMAGIEKYSDAYIGQPSYFQHPTADSKPFQYIMA